MLNCHMGLCTRGKNNLPDKPETWSAAVQVFGKDSILHLGGVETADSREAWAADTNMEVCLPPILFVDATHAKPAAVIT